jgi:hypothetical protein
VHGAAEQQKQITPKKPTDHKPFDYWLKKNNYYHRQTERFYALHIPRNASVLHIGCKNGYLLGRLQPFFGVGIDDDQAEIRVAQERFPEYQFFSGDITAVQLFHRFDYIILPFTMMEVDDIQGYLAQLHRFCHPGTRLILKTYSYVWEPLLSIAQKFGFKRPTALKHWLSGHDVDNFLYLAGFDVFRHDSYMLMPLWIPGVSWIFNHLLCHVPLIRSLCLHRLTVARPFRMSYNRTETNVSVIVTCKNERGNIEAAVQRIPRMGNRTEIIFVEGGSRDGTLQEIERVAQLYKNKNIKVLVQDGTGKGDAVRKGFAYATGDILMILDGDLTTPPEDLPKFFDALVSGKGDFINGSRLVYGMEDKAMRFLNMLANYCFGIGFSWVLGQRIKDTLCGTKVLFKKDYERIARERGFLGFEDPFGDFDLLFGAARLNLKIVDMPVEYKNRTYGSTNIHRFFHGWYLLKMSLRAFIIFKW